MPAIYTTAGEGYGTSQKQVNDALVTAVLALATALDALATKLNGDSGVNLTNYAATNAAAVNATIKKGS